MPSSRQIPFSAPRPQRFTGGALQSFQGLQAQNVVLREAQQPFPNPARTGRFRGRSRDWQQTSSRNPVNNLIRQGFVSRFVGQSADGQRLGHRSLSINNAHVGQRGSSSFQTPSTAPSLNNVRGTRHFGVSHAVGTQRSSRIVTAPQSSFSDQNTQLTHHSVQQSSQTRPVVRQAVQTAVVRPVERQPANAILIRPAGGQSAQTAAKTFVPEPVVQSVNQHISQHVPLSGSATQQPTPQRTVPSAPISQTSAVQSGTLVSSSAANPVIASAGTAATQIIQSTAPVQGEPTLEEDLQLISTVSALLQAVGSPIQLSVPNVQIPQAAVPVQTQLGPVAHRAGLAQFGRAVHPRMINPWMGHLGSAHLQELMFGDTTDPPDIVPTTTVAPNVTISNTSEPVLNVSIVTAPVKAVEHKQIPAPQGSDVTPVPTASAPPPETQTETVHMIQESALINTKVHKDANLAEKPPMLKVEPLPDTQVKPVEQISGEIKEARTTKTTGKDISPSNAVGIDLINIISDALKKVSYPATLRKALVKELSTVLINENKRNVSQTIVETNYPVTTVSDTTTASVGSEKLVTTETPIDLEIRTDRLPTAADLGVVIPDVPTTPVPEPPQSKKTKVITLTDASKENIRVLVKNALTKTLVGTENINKAKVNIPIYSVEKTTKHEITPFVEDTPHNNLIKAHSSTKNDIKIEVKTKNKAETQNYSVEKTTNRKLTPIVEDTAANSLIKDHSKTKSDIKIEIKTNTKADIPNYSAEKTSNHEITPIVEDTAANSLIKDHSKTKSDIKIEVKTKTKADIPNYSDEKPTNHEITPNVEDTVANSLIKEHSKTKSDIKIEVKTKTKADISNYSAEKTTNHEINPVVGDTAVKRLIKNHSSMKSDIKIDVKTKDNIPNYPADKTTNREIIPIVGDTAAKSLIKDHSNAKNDIKIEVKTKTKLNVPTDDIPIYSAEKTTNHKNIPVLEDAAAKSLIKGQSNTKSDIKVELKTKTKSDVPTADISNYSAEETTNHEIAPVVQDTAAKKLIKDHSNTKSDIKIELKTKTKADVPNYSIEKTVNHEAIPILADSLDTSLINAHANTKSDMQIEVKTKTKHDVPKYSAENTANYEANLFVRDTSANSLINAHAPTEGDMKVEVKTKASGKETKPSQTIAMKDISPKSLDLNINHINNSKGKPAFEIVLESLVTQSGSGVEFLSRPVASVDPAIVNKLTTMPKLAGVVNPGVKKQLIETKKPLDTTTLELNTVKIESASEKTIDKLNVSDTSAEANKKSSDATTALNDLMANISKDSILNQIDLASLVKELSLISNGTDITAHLSDPLFVKILEDIVTQTLSGAVNGTTPDNQTTAIPEVVTTEEYELEIEAEDITTTAATVTTTANSDGNKPSKGNKPAKGNKPSKG